MGKSAMPRVTAFPECPTCGAAYVLRRGLVFKAPKSRGTAAVVEEWAWQRDCKHKSEPRIGVSR